MKFRVELYVELRAEPRVELRAELRAELQGRDPLKPPGCITYRIKINLNKEYFIALYIISFYPLF